EERFGRSPGPDHAESAPPAQADGNPFLAARTEFMNAFGDLAKGKRNWQLTAYGLMGLLALVTLADLRLAASSRVVPYVVQVDLASVLRVPNSDVWRLQWTETERSTQAGGLTRTVAWESYLTVQLIPPTTPESLQDNPLGLSITSVSWTQVAGGASSSTPDS